MISIQAAVTIILYLIVGGIIFGLLWWLIHRIKLFEPFMQVAEAILLILAVFAVIGILISLLTGQQLFRP